MMETIVLILLVLAMNSNGETTCTAPGKYPNPDDPTCRAYYICTRLPSGRLVRSDYNCWNSLFDPTTQKCSPHYQCGTSSTPNDVPPEPKPEFVCPTAGIFADLTDTTCKTFYYCFEFFGMRFKTAQKCVNSNFDPGTSKCSTDYSCYTDGPATSTNPPATPTDASATWAHQGTERNEFTTSEPEILSEEEGKESNPPGDNFNLGVARPDDLKEGGAEQEFSCASSGMFPDLSDETCTKYFYCIPMADGSYTKRVYRCVNSYFDPELKKCSSGYVCGQNTEPKEADPESTREKEYITSGAEDNFYQEHKGDSYEVVAGADEKDKETDAPSDGKQENFACQTAGKFADVSDPTCQRYFLCSTLRNGTVIKTEYSCPNSTFDPSLQACSGAYVCSTTPAPTSPTAEGQGSSEFTCTEMGKFADETDLSCQRYFMCSEKYDGTFLQKELSCYNSYFDPSTQLCSKTYVCPDKTTATDDPQATSEATSTDDDTSSRFICTSAGKFADYTDSTCQRYFMCSKKYDGTFLQKELNCYNSYFDPNTQLCSKTYVCPDETEVSDEPQATSESTSTGEGETPTGFICTSAGKFSDYTDSTCQRYFMCSEKYDGTFLQKNLSCYNSFFDPNTQLCSKTYVCPDESEISDEPQATSEPTSTGEDDTSTGFICTSTGKFVDYTDSTCQRYFMCSEKYDGTFLQKELSCVNSYFDPGVQLCSRDYVCPGATLITEETQSAGAVTNTPDEKLTSVGTNENETLLNFEETALSAGFVCTSTGKYADGTDLTCQRYFMCSKKYDGTFLQKKLSCYNSYFDPNTQLCSKTYICPEETEVSGKPQATSESTSIGEGETPNEFTCTSAGKYADYTDSTCQRYFMCSQKYDGTFLQKELSCYNSYFDPSTQLCSKTYVCPDESAATEDPQATSEATSTDEDDTSTGFICTSAGKFADYTDSTCQRYFMCSKKYDGTFLQKELNCYNSYFDPNTQLCSKTYECPDETEVSDEPQATSESTSTGEGETPTGFICTSAGKFSDYTDSTCQRYFMCSEKYDGTFLQKNLSCYNSFFDPNTQLCSKTYVCPDESEISDEPQATSEPTSTGEDDTSTGFICTSTGKFVDYTDSTCQRYFMCSEKYDGTFLQKELSCVNSYFDPGVQLCSRDYVCPGATLITEETQSAGAVTNTPDERLTSAGTNENETSLNFEETASSAGFVCTSTGKYADGTDLTCQRYFMCSKKYDGTFLQKKLSCYNSYFDPNTQLCSKTYICPEETEVSGKPQATSESTSIGEGETPNEFTCTSAGKYADYTDSTCQRYFMCSQKYDGTFLQKELSCYNSYFDPTTQLCSKTYVCPDETAATDDPQATTEAGEDETTTEFTCTSAGKYADYTDSTCQRYFMCSQKYDGTFLQKELSCYNSYFDPTTQLCSKTYVCPDETAATDDPQATTEAGEDEASTEFTCTSAGKYADNTDSTCQRYFMCSQKYDGTFLQKELSCYNSYFDPNTQLCSKTYLCPDETEVSDEPQASTGEGETSTEFICTSAGKFSDYTDSTCQRYFMCSEKYDGTFLQKNLSCYNSFFDPNTQLCSKTYVCPDESEISDEPQATSEPTSTGKDDTSTGFICTSTGKFVDYTDSTCQRYFMCSEKYDGTFLQKELSCVNSYFDPGVQLCSRDYVCPGATLITEETQSPGAVTNTPDEKLTSVGTNENETLLNFEETASSAGFVCTSTGKYADGTDLTCQRYFMCSKKYDGTFLQKKLSCYNSYFDPNTQLCSKTYICPEETEVSGKPQATSESTSIGEGETPNEFTCTSAGKYADYTDSTCQRYFMCSQKYDGTFLQKELSCYNSYFDPTTQLCSKTYVCPDETAATDDPQATTDAGEGEASIEFTCTSAGKYADNTDSTCQRYFMCSQKYDGTFLQKELSCYNSYFDPTTQLCSKTYVCPDETAATDDPQATSEAGEGETTTEFTCSSAGKYADYTDSTCQRYFMCSQKYDGTFLQKELSCYNSYFDPTTQLCSKTYTCPDEMASSDDPQATSETTSTEEGEHSAEFTCTSAGKYEDDTDSTCQRYFMCSQKYDGTFLQKELSCVNSYFDASLQLCSKEYVCPYISTITDPPPSTIATKNFTESGPLLLSEFMCASAGRFANANDPTCQRYFLCSKLKNGTFVKTEYSCPDSHFDPSLQGCSKDYQCPFEATTTEVTRLPTTTKDSPSPSTATEESSTLAPPTAPQGFVCTGTGRFPDVNDPTCELYFLCTKLRNGTFLKTEYSCPDSYFDPYLQACSKDYDCPYLSTTEATTARTTASAETEVTSPLVETTTLQDFVCTSKGRFPDPGDRTCHQYFLCSMLNNGTFIKTGYRCPDSFFDPAISKCSKEYACPFSTTTETTVPTLSSTPEEFTVEKSTQATTPNTAAPTETKATSPQVETTTPQNFVCTVKGRFPDPNDRTCHQYFLCSMLNNGTFIKTGYRCPDSFFDPAISKCSKEYVCPFSTTTETTVPTLSSTSEEFTVEESTQPTTLNTPAPTETEVTSPKVETTTLQDFVCTVKGRFPDPNDRTCHQYYLCSMLNNGTFIKTGYRCPDSFFDPAISKCSKEYVCPFSTTTETTIPTLSSTSEEFTVEESTQATTPNTAAPTETEVTSPQVETTTPQNFVCTVKGRFPDPNDRTCHQYFLCSMLNNGTFIKTGYRCPDSFFDPAISKCSKEYVCPFSTTTETTVPTLSSTSEEFTVEESTQATTPNTAAPTETEVTRPQVETTTLQDFVCTVKGRFPDPNDRTCHQYYLCSMLNNGTFIKTGYRCPDSLFDPAISKCSKEYVCPFSTTTETTVPTLSSTSEEFTVEESTQATTPNTAAPTETEVTSPQVETTTLQDFVCTVKGRFPDPNDRTCHQYFLCSMLNNGTFLKTGYRCPDSFFDPAINKCSKEYVCPFSTTTETTVPTLSSTSEEFTVEESTQATTPNTAAPTKTEVTSPQVETTTLQDFVCTVKGRFPDPNDRTCHQYFLCSMLNNGTFIKTGYRCPDSFFDPAISKCSKEYVCPFSTTTETTFPTLSSTTEEFTVEESTQTTTPKTAAPTETEVTSPLVETTTLQDFVCTLKGRFPDPNDRTCHQYFLCSMLNNGTFIKTGYRCPDSFFDPAISKCSKEYVCPFTTTTETTVPTLSSATEEFTVEESTTEEFTVEKSTTEEIAAESPTTEESTSTSIIYDFTCAKVGRFADMNDRACEWYYLCNQLRNGTFIQTPYRCPSTSVFDPKISICSTQIVCPYHVLAS